MQSCLCTRDSIREGGGGGGGLGAYVIFVENIIKPFFRVTPRVTPRNSAMEKSYSSGHGVESLLSAPSKIPLFEFTSRIVVVAAFTVARILPQMLFSRDRFSVSKRQMCGRSTSDGCGSNHHSAQSAKFRY